MQKLKVPDLFVEKNFLNGLWIDSVDKFAVINPANGTVIGHVPNHGVAQTEQVINDAQNAWDNYRNLTAKQRADLLFRLRKLILLNQDDLARIITLEQGKPLKEAYAEINSGATIIEWFAEEVKRIYGETMPTHVSNKRLMTIKQPIGVVAAITPWNFPSSMICRKVAPALAAGCPVIIKPAEQTPFSALALAYLTQLAGFPAGVFNVITGDAPTIGKVLCDSKKVRKLSFTGSTEVGRILLAQSAKTIKKVSLELGGNAPFIVYDDADIDKAVTGAIASKFRNAGQTCVCANRFFVHDSLHDEFVEKLLSRIQLFKVADGFNKDSNIGPLINQQAIDNTLFLIDDAVKKGAQLVCGGKVIKDLFFQPTLITNVDSSMLIAQQEIFAPVACITKFASEEQSIALANDTDLGLAGYFYSNDISRIYRVAEQLETGMLGINTGSISTELAPFGGVKQSGLGREGSKYGIDEYIEIKFLCIGID